MAFIRSAFNHAFKTYPLITNSVIYGGLYCTAEFSQQTVLKKVFKKPDVPEPPYDTGSLQRYFTIGTCAISPTLYLWYKWLDKKLPGTAVKTVVKKCLMDQFMMTPNILIMFYVGMSLMEGKEDVFSELKQKFVPTFAANCCFWLPTQAMNFTFIPPQFRVIYIGVCTLAWVNILCYFKRNN
jgi:Mpv17-like protein